MTPETTVAAIEVLSEPVEVAVSTTTQEVTVHATAAPEVEIRCEPVEVQLQPQAPIEVTVNPAGVPGPPGPRGLTGGRLLVALAVDTPPLSVLLVDVDDTARPASSLTPGEADRIVGVTPHGGRAGEATEVVTRGELALPADLPVGSLHLGLDGALTPDPDTGAVSLRVAVALTPRRLLVDPQPPIHHP